MTPGADGKPGAGDDVFKSSQKVLEDAGVIEPAGKAPRKRRGQAVKQKGAPATFQPLSAASPSAAGLKKKPPGEEHEDETEEEEDERAAKLFNPAKKAEELRVWWVAGKDRFVVMPPAEEAEEGCALSLTREDVKMRLRIAGVRGKAYKGKTHSQTDLVLNHIQNQRGVVFAGEVAGYRVGIHETGSGRIAITNSFRLVKPRRGQWPVLRAFLDTWFEDDGESQLDYFLAWLQTAIAALRAGIRTRPGFLLALVGPSNCGKTFAQMAIIKPLLGGRAADPLPWLLGDEKFNDDVARAEAQLVSEMRGCKIDNASRADLGEAFKTMLVNPDTRLRGPYSSAIMVETYRRLCISLNDEVDRLKVFPPLAAGFVDKVLMLLCQRPTLPSTASLDEWTALGAAIASELPAFAHYLEHEWKIPPRLIEGKDAGRWGFNCYIHPRLASSLFEQEPESLLLHLLDNTPDLWRETGADGRSRDVTAWGWKSAEELREAMFEGPRGETARKAFTHSGGFAQYLGKLEVRDPERFKKKHTRNGNVWLVSKAKN